MDEAFDVIRAGPGRVTGFNGEEDSVYSVLHRLKKGQVELPHLNYPSVKMRVERKGPATVGVKIIDSRN